MSGLGLSLALVPDCRHRHQIAVGDRFLIRITCAFGDGRLVTVPSVEKVQSFAQRIVDSHFKFPCF